MTGYPTGAGSRVYSAFAYLAFAVTATWATGFLADLRVRFEERDLHRQLGDLYGEYARRVPRFVPRHLHAVLRSETKAGLS